MKFATLIIKVAASKDCNVQIAPIGLDEVTIYRKGDTKTIYMATGYTTNDFFYGIIRDDRMAGSPAIRVPVKNCTIDEKGSSEDKKCFVVTVPDKLDVDNSYPVEFLDDTKRSLKNQILANIRKLTH